MMKYEKYKPSEIDWSLDIPAHWEVRRIKDVASVISKGTTPSTEGEAYTDFGVRYLKAENINDNGSVAENPVFFISESTNKLLSRSILKANDLLLVIAGATTGKIAILKPEQLPANTNQAVCFIRLGNKEKETLQYKYYFINSSYIQSLVWLYAVTSAQPNLPMAVLSRFSLYYPPVSEQTAIAEYLDAKTQAIDKKINLLTKKAETYKELRKSIINDAVCKGLDKSVKLKESGIDWIGNVPTHWEIIRIKDVFNQISKIGSEIGVNNYIPLENIESQTGKLIQRISNENNEVTNLFKKGDILVNKLRPYLAKVYLPEFDGGVSGEVIVFRVSNVNQKKISSKYYFYRFLSSQFIEKINSITDGVKMPRTNPTKINCLEIAFPPLSEQTAIANYLDEKTQKIDAIVSNIGKQIDTLKELRKTLINDVVTGKIKVSEPLIDID